MRYLTVLDYHSGRIFQTEIKEYKDLYKELHIEELLDKSGFQVNNCSWMVSEYPNIEKF